MILKVYLIDTINIPVDSIKIEKELCTVLIILKIKILKKERYVKFRKLIIKKID